MTNTQKLAKNAFRKLRHLILSADYGDKNLKEYTLVLSNLYSENQPRISDFQSIGELDMISIFGFQLCRQRIVDAYHSVKKPSNDFNELIKQTSTIEQAINNVLDFDKLSMLLDHRIGDLTESKEED